VRDITYPPIIVTAKLGFRLLDFRFQMTGTEHVPREGGALIAFNHISYIDFILGGYAAQPSKRLIRFMAKREIFDHKIAGPLMRSFHHISVDRADGLDSYNEAIRYLQAGEVVGIFPEATISRSFELQPLKTGAVRIAADAGVPLIPIVLWGTQRFLTKGKPRDFGRHKTVGIEVGEPMHPTTADDPDALTAQLQARMEAMLDGLIRRHPAEEQPPGSWWLPASYGGSAPTPEEAAAMYAEERRLRAQRKAAKRAGKAKR
jgi:1-acyl-sn-glycerol-3-phosphate acyltransferase